MATTNDVYKLNDQLKEEEKQKENNANAAYANQLYGNSGSAANVGASGTAAQSDYGQYLAQQNADLSKGQKTSVTARALPNKTGAVLQQKAAAQPVAQPQPQANNAYSSLSQYDQKLGQEYRDSIVAAKQRWQDAQTKGDKAAMQDAYIDAQLARAQGGGYIDNVGDGSGYAAFGYGDLSAADRNLPQEAKDAILRYKLLYMNAASDADRDYYNQMANKIRSEYGGYTSADGKDYKPNSILDMPYQDNSTFEDPYADEIDSLSKYIGDWDPSSYDPENDAVYKAYEDHYTRNANAAAQKALALAAANTGGIASSAAQQLSAAAAQSYMKQLSDMIPTLYENARAAHNDNVANRNSVLNTLGNLQSSAYDRYNNDRTFALNTWLQNWQNAAQMKDMENQLNESQAARDWSTEQAALDRLENQKDRDLQKYLAQLK